MRTDTVVVVSHLIAVPTKDCDRFVSNAIKVLAVELTIAVYLFTVGASSAIGVFDGKESNIIQAAAYALTTKLGDDVEPEFTVFSSGRGVIPGPARITSPLIGRVGLLAQRTQARGFQRGVASFDAH